MWVHLGADDSLGGSLYVGRQTKECRSVILWEILYYAAVVLERHTPMQVTHKKLKREGECQHGADFNHGSKIQDKIVA